MIPVESFVYNLELCDLYREIEGSVVECGVWRGGMSAGMAELLGDERIYYLFDSFEGLPEAHEIDGKDAIAWQSEKDSETYFDNCKSEMEVAEKAMALSGANKVKIIKGWFAETLSAVQINVPIAILRLDCDWYDSTLECITRFYPMLAEGGLILMDDYFMWDGFAKAIHDYLSANKLPVRIRQWKNSDLYYIVKKSDL